MAVKKKINFTYPYESAWSDADQLLLFLDTGSWRTIRPVVDADLCTYCGQCTLYCPPQCMIDKGDHFEANLAYCKGCGICAKECPRKAIKMVPEG
jgi:2-oxoacid:acceptor oxidoreductase delta subunit (pyruvate/2-ketoisovalerate family)